MAIDTTAGQIVQSLDVNGETDADGWTFSFTGNGAHDDLFEIVGSDIVVPSATYIYPGVKNVETNSIKGADSITRVFNFSIKDRGVTGFSVANFLSINASYLANWDDDWSIELSAVITDLAAESYLLEFANGGENFLKIDTSGDVQFGGQGAGSTMTSVSSYIVGQWIPIKLVSIAGEVDLIVDGESVGSQSNNPWANQGANALFIGAGGAGVDTVGIISNLKVTIGGVDVVTEEFKTALVDVTNLTEAGTPTYNTLAGL